MNLRCKTNVITLLVQIYQFTREVMRESKLKIKYNNETFWVSKNVNLRKAILQNELFPYNQLSKILNCRGLGTCGTCAVKIEGDVSDKTKIEKWRLNFPPHKETDSLRLACQCKILGDLKITKYYGFWGEKV
jgi:ferredoxin